jgi:very-short-patch-repair endonuclease
MLKKFNGKSRLEDHFKKILKELNLRFIYQFEFKGKLFDFLLPDHDLLIEIGGDFFHCNKELGYKPKYSFQRKNIKNDKIKNLIAENSDYTLIRFWENDINLNKKKIVETLCSLTGIEYEPTKPQRRSTRLRKFKD